MTRHLGTILRRERGGESRTSFAKRLGLSYTFVRSLEEGLRLPSDDVLSRLAASLGLDPDCLVLAAYFDRSAALSGAMTRAGLDIAGVMAKHPPAALPARRSAEPDTVDGGYPVSRG